MDARRLKPPPSWEQQLEQVGSSAAGVPMVPYRHSFLPSTATATATAAVGVAESKSGTSSPQAPFLPTPNTSITTNESVNAVSSDGYCERRNVNHRNATRPRIASDELSPEHPRELANAASPPRHLKQGGRAPGPHRLHASTPPWRGETVADRAADDLSGRRRAARAATPSDGDYRRPISRTPRTPLEGSRAATRVDHA